MIKEDQFCLLDDYDNEENPYNNTSQLLCKECIQNYKRCIFCEGLFDVEGISIHIERCKTIYFCLEELPENFKETVKCKFCSCILMLDEYPRHENNCKQSADPLLIECKFCKKNTLAEFIETHEKKCEILQTVELFKNESLSCTYCGRYILLLEYMSHESMCQRRMIEEAKIKKEYEKLEVNYPEEWGKEIALKNDKDDYLSVITLTRETQFKFVSDMVKYTMPNVNIVNIYRIENKHLWCKYQKERTRVFQEKQTANESWLFHGTKLNDPELFFLHGFDISFASDGGLYGRGIYFAKNFTYSFKGYSHNKNNCSYLFLARVITGTSCYLKKNGKDLKKPPLYDANKNIYFDSVTNLDEKSKVFLDSHMFVVYENDKAYPFYLIEYTS
jgi:hypothetical protein